MVFGGESTAVCTCSLLLSLNVPSLTVGYGCGVEGKSQPVCVVIPTWAHTCWSRGALWALLSAWPWGKSQDGQGLPSSFSGRLSCAKAGDMHWGMNPVLDASLLKGAKGVEGAEKQPQVVCLAMSFASYQLYFGKAAMKQRSRTGARAMVAVWCSCHVFSPSLWHLALVRLWQGGFPRRNKLSPEPKKEHSCLLPRWQDSKGPGCREKGFADRLGHSLLSSCGILTCGNRRVRRHLSLGIRRAHGSTAVLPPSFVWHSGSAGALLSAEGHSISSLFPLFSVQPMWKATGRKSVSAGGQPQNDPTHCLLPGPGNQEGQLLGLCWEIPRGCSHHTARPHSTLSLSVTRCQSCWPS